jgi:hypothetical protein
VQVWALVNEAALRCRVGDAPVMHEQLMHLIEESQRPNVGIQVLPGMEGHPGLLGAFAIAERAGHPSIVYLEDAADGRVTDDPAIVQHTMYRFRSLQARALPANASRDLIARVVDEQWKIPARTGARALTAVATEETV